MSTSRHRAYIKALKRARKHAISRAVARVPRFALAMGRPYSNVPGIKSERKYYSVYYTDGALVASTDWTGTEFDGGIGCMFAPTQGSTIVDRIGRRVDVLSVRVHGQFRLPGAAGVATPPVACTVRLVVYIDSRANGIQSQGEQVMQATGSASAVDQPLTFRALTNLDRFKVLGDITETLEDPNVVWDSATSTYDNCGVTKNFTINYKFKKPYRVTFNAGNVGNIGDLNDGAIHLICNCSAIANNPRLTYVARTCFIDV